MFFGIGYSKEKVKNKIIELDQEYRLRYTELESYFMNSLNKLFSGTVALVDNEDFSETLFKKLGGDYSEMIRIVQTEKKKLLGLFKYKEIINVKWIGDDDSEDKTKYLKDYLEKTEYRGVPVDDQDKYDNSSWVSNYLGRLCIFNDSSECKVYDSPSNSDANEFLQKTIKKYGRHIFLGGNRTIDSFYTDRRGSQTLKLLMPDCNMLAYFPNVRSRFYVRIVGAEATSWSDFFQMKDFIIQFTPFGVLVYDIYPKKKELGPLDRFFAEYGE